MTSPSKFGVGRVRKKETVVHDREELPREKRQCAQRKCLGRRPESTSECPERDERRHERHGIEPIDRKQPGDDGHRQQTARAAFVSSERDGKHYRDQQVRQRVLEP
jgi:hypothetical protein